MPSKMAWGVVLLSILTASLCAPKLPAADAPTKARQGVAGEAETKTAVQSFDVTRSDDLKTRMDSKDIWYKGRLPSKVKANVWVKDGKDGSLQVGLAKFDREINAEGPRRFLRFDARELDERLDGKRVQYLEAGASKADDLGLKYLTALPWFELAHGPSNAWTSATLAEGEAWPLADAMDLGREAALLLPQVSFAEFSKGRSTKVRCALPFPAPFSPEPEANVSYTLRDVSGSGNDRVGTIDLSGSNTATPKGGVEWGGIRVKGAEVRATVEGTLKVVLATQKLVEGRIKVDIAVRKGEAFESVYRVESTWRSAESR